MKIIDLFDGFVGGVIAGISTLAATVKIVVVRPINNRIDDLEGRVDDVEDQSEKAAETAESNEYVLHGDPDDPNYSGVAQDVHEIKEIVEEIRDERDGD